MENRVMSGIQPTGDIHIGNYLGAIKQWVEMTKDHLCFYVIVDYHAITIQYDASRYAEDILRATMVNMACGLTPENCLLFPQSHVPEHTELAWVFNTCTMVGRLTNMTQYKEKAAQHAANVNAGLLNYPILQAADILIYKASKVPVGEDQLQHLELTREIARRFNSNFGETFPQPVACGKSIRLLGLDGEQKMSKSLNNYIGMLDDEKTIWDKLRPAKTDVQRIKKSDPGRPYMCNVYSMHEFFTPEDERKECYENCEAAAFGCIDCKKILLKNMLETIRPIQERYYELEKDRDYVKDFLRQSARKAREHAKQTIDEVRSKLGLWI